MTQLVEITRTDLRVEALSDHRSLVEEQKKVIEAGLRVADDLIKVQERLARLAGPKPSADICPRCYYRHGRRETLLPASNPHPRSHDPWTCRECENEDDRPIRKPLTGSRGTKRAGTLLAPFALAISQLHNSIGALRIKGLRAAAQGATK
jgi:hypothetical protein